MPLRLPPKPVVDLSHLRDKIDKGPWLVYQGSRPGVYTHHEIVQDPGLNGLVRSYKDRVAAERDLEICQRCGLLEWLNRPEKKEDRFVVTEGYRVGIFSDWCMFNEGSPRFLELTSSAPAPQHL
ncbi:hypothetical protein PM082_015508 [Marasmius tenuissimus]|nr:hypothetical protein PM082_015508 [Marasmius tenuissimus]